MGGGENCVALLRFWYDTEVRSHLTLALLQRLDDEQGRVEESVGAVCCEGELSACTRKPFKGDERTQARLLSPTEP